MCCRQLTALVDGGHLGGDGRGGGVCCFGQSVCCFISGDADVCRDPLKSGSASLRCQPTEFVVERGDCRCVLVRTVEALEGRFTVAVDVYCCWLQL